MPVCSTCTPADQIYDHPAPRGQSRRRPTSRTPSAKSPSSALRRTRQHARTRFTRPHPHSAVPRPSWCPRPPSPRTSPEKSSARDGSRPKGRPGPGDGRIKPAPPSRGVVWPRGAPYGLRARPWRPLPHPLPRGRLRSGDSSRSGERLASAPARRRGGGTGLRAAPSRRTSVGPARARPHDPAPAERTPTDELPRRFRQKNTTKPHKNHKKS